MKILDNLLTNVGVVETYGKRSVEIDAITDDSRKVNGGSLFVAIKGLNVDAHEYISQAIQNGTSAVVGEEEPKDDWINKITYIKVKDSRDALGKIASAWFDNPSDKLKVIGVTGTKGKSTTCYLLYELLKTANKKVGMVTSMGAIIGNQEIDTGFHVTNPSQIDLQRFLSQMVDEECEYAILEITSHGLDQKRVSGVIFDISVLTNIKHEHLDYHKTFEAYKNAKSKLFKNIKVAVLNKDDENYDYIIGKLGRNTKLITYSIDNKSDYKAEDIHLNEIMNFNIISGKEKINIETNYLGDYNALNILAAVAVARNEGVDWELLQKSLKEIPIPPGRLEKITNDKGIDIYIDFAHTPDSLEKVLQLLRKKTKGRLICVFGCASERDVLKRPMMGEISTKLADISIFTTEDSRNENILKILSEIQKGVVDDAFETSIEQVNDYEGTNVYLKIPEREQAISAAINRIAKSGDTIVFCGKGHEASMAFEGVEHPWSDKRFIEAALRIDENKTAVILAAGRGTRLNGEDQKVLRKIAGKPMITYTISNLIESGFGNILVVCGYKKEELKERINGFVNFVIQKKPLGTGDALKTALDKIPQSASEFLVMNGDDSAFYDAELINDVWNTHIKVQTKITFVSVVVDNPQGYGRIHRDDKGNLKEIVEEKDANEEIKKINEVNDGLYIFNHEWLSNNISKVKKNKQSGEFYIVDLVKIALNQGRHVQVYRLDNDENWQGVNTQEQLEKADKKMRKKIDKSFN